VTVELCVLSVGRHTRHTIDRMLESVASQSTPADRVLVSDDCTSLYSRRVEGTRATLDLARACGCDGNRIFVIVDADDELLPGCLSALRTCYDEDPELDVCWTQHIIQRGSMTWSGVSGPIEKGADVYEHPWMSSHCKSFRSNLLLHIDDQNFRGEDGRYFRRIADQALMLPLLTIATRWKYVPEVLYVYNAGEQSFEDRDLQRREEVYLRARGFVSSTVEWTRGPSV
jgi:glycosyltransferase involved in cell wall biosynthesis